jgi:hypothetical protein
VSWPSGIQVLLFGRFLHRNNGVSLFLSFVVSILPIHLRGHELSFASKELTPKRIERYSRERERGIVYLISAGWADAFKEKKYFYHFKDKLGHGL